MDETDNIHNISYFDFAWECLRRNHEYINEWKIYADNCQRDPGLRSPSHQNKHDLQAEEKWGLIKYLDPDNSDPKDVFWSERFSHKSMQAILYDSNEKNSDSILSVEQVNLRKMILYNGQLCVKIFNSSDYFQFFISDYPDVLNEIFMSVCVPISMSPKKINDKVQLINEIIHQKNNKNINVDKRLILLNIIDDIDIGCSHKDIAYRLFGKQMVDTEWSSDSWMRSNIRYRIKNAMSLVKTEYVKYI